MMPIAFAIFALLALTTLRLREYRSILTPDAQAYSEMATGDAVPAPYCWRVGYPAVSRLAARLSGFKTVPVMRVVGLSSYLCVLPATIWLACSMGASLAYAVGAAFLLMASPSMFSYPIVIPYLADCLAAPLAVAASALVMQGHPWIALIVMLALGFVKESYLAMAAAFTLVLNPLLWWVPVPGLAAHLVLRHKTKRVDPPDNRKELATPFRTVSKLKRVGFWFSNSNSLRQAGAAPYVFTWYAPGIVFLWPVVAVCVLAWLQAHIGMDHDRLIWQSGPWLLAALVTVVPAGVLLVTCLVSMWCPWQEIQSEKSGADHG